MNPEKQQETIIIHIMLFRTKGNVNTLLLVEYYDKIRPPSLSSLSTQDKSEINIDQWFCCCLCCYTVPLPA